MVLIASMVVLLARDANETVSARQKSQWDGVYSEAQSKRGEALYGRSCVTCPGTDLKGGERAPALAGPAFSGRWSERPLGALFEYTSVMMPLQSPGGFNGQQNADIVAYTEPEYIGFQTQGARMGWRNIRIKAE